MEGTGLRDAGNVRPLYDRMANVAKRERASQIILQRHRWSTLQALVASIGALRAADDVGRRLALRPQPS
jgi:hypothetical protein